MSIPHCLVHDRGPGVTELGAGLHMEDHQSQAWGDLRNSLERLVKESLHINANQCLHMQSKILKLLQALLRDQSPAAQEFFSTVLKRAMKLVEECSTERWLLKAVEIGDCPEHFMELYLDLRWSSSVLSLAGQELISISEVYKGRDEDKRSLMLKVNQVLEGELDNNHRRCHADQQLAAILKNRNECSTPQTSPPHDLNRYVRRFKFNILHKCQLHRVRGGSSFVVKYRWVYGKKFVLKLALKFCREFDHIMKREAEIMDKCRHPYVVGLVGCWEVKESKSFIVMECMGCTLKELIAKRRITDHQGFSASDAIDLMLPIAKALRYMHGKEKPIAHRDIKPENIMCSREPEVARTKLIDFGDSVEFDPSYFNRNGAAFTKHSYGVAGTTGYMAPEVRNCSKVEHCESLQSNVFPFCDLLQADVFSFGMVLGELLTCKAPDEAGGRQISKARLNGLLECGWRPHLPNHVPVYVAFIVESCWRKSPSTRPSFEDICLMLQNAQHLLRSNVTAASADTSSLVSYTDSDAAEWPIERKFTLREMLNLEDEIDSDSLFHEFLL